MEPAILGTARLNNFRLGYRPAALTALRETRVRITLDGALVRVRRGSVTIRDVLNDEPNTCSLTIDDDTPPQTAERLRITINSDTPRLLFAGDLQTVNESYEGLPAQRVFPCTAQDDTPRANRRLPLGYWANTSATTIAQWLVSNFAPDFTSTHVQAGLPAVTVLFDGSEGGMNGCLRQLAKLIGGYFYWEDFDLHLFTEETADPPDALDLTPNRFLNDPPIRMESDDSQLRTRVYGKGHQEQTLSDVDVSSPSIPIGDASFFPSTGGQANSEEQIITFTATAAGGLGALIGTTVTPTSGPAITKRATTGLTAGAYGYKATFTTAAGETLPGPATAVTLGDAVPAPVTGPTVAKVLGGNLSAGVYKWKVAYVTAAGETLASIESGSVTMDDVAAPSAIGTAAAFASGAVAITYKMTFTNGSVETLPGPASNTAMTNPGAGRTLTRSGNSTPPAGFSRQFYRDRDGNGYKKLLGASNGFDSDDPSFYYDNTDTGSDAGLGGAIPGASTAVYRSANLTGIPVSPDALVTTRRIYRTEANGSTFKVVADINDNTTTVYTDNVADGSLGATELGTATALYLATDLTSIPVGPSGTTGRKVYRTAVGGSTYKLLTTIANNTTTTFTDTTADGSLGADAPSSDTSGLVAQTGDVSAGSTSILVTSTVPFNAAGGWATIGGLAIRYTGVGGASITGVPSSGPGALSTTVRYGSEIVSAAALTGVTGLTRALIKGAPINVWVQRDDTAAQAELTARDGSDGIVEHRIVDERRNATSLAALCDADLEQFSRPIVTVTYASRDVKTKSGKTIVIDIPSPEIQQTLTIQDVTITELDIAPRLAPRFTVTASTIRFSVEDILRRLATTSLGGN